MATKEHKPEETVTKLLQVECLKSRVPPPSRSPIPRHLDTARPHNTTPRYREKSNFIF